MGASQLGLLEAPQATAAVVTCGRTAGAGAQLLARDNAARRPATRDADLGRLARWCALQHGGHPATRWVRNLAANPALSVHLESGEDVAILEGSVEDVITEAETGTRIIAAWDAKYGRLLQIHQAGYRAPAAASGARVEHVVTGG